MAFVSSVLSTDFFSGIKTASLISESALETVILFPYASVVCRSAFALFLAVIISPLFNFSVVVQVASPLTALTVAFSALFT